MVRLFKRAAGMLPNLSPTAKIMFMFIYHFLWTLVLFPVLPFGRFLKVGRVAERFALSLPAVSLGEGSFWIHALSVGEVISAIPLVDAVRERFPDKEIVFSVTTARGMDVARAKLDGKIKALLTMPLDCWWCARRMVSTLRPSLFVLVETDIWPGLIDYLRRRGIKSILVNGRVSPRTFRSYLRFPSLARAMFSPLELCLMQTDLDRDRLLRLGLSSQKVKTVGNIKFDQEFAPLSREDRARWLNLLGIAPEERVWVAGSTHPGEEEAVLETFKRLRESGNPLRLILAPRHIERCDEIRRCGESLGFRVALRTEIPEHYDVLLLDTLGELARLYGLADVSFVGGSLVPIGGHNLLEPASHACPVLFGPYTHNFALMSDLLEKAGGGRCVKDTNELHWAIRDLLGDAGLRGKMGAAALGFVQKNRGALDRVVAHIQALSARHLASKARARQGEEEP